jgi:hypothetical protein
MLRRLVTLLPPSVAEKAYDVKYRALPFPFSVVRPHTMLSYLNLFFLQELADRLNRERVPGAFVECGVYRGGSAGILGFEACRTQPVRPLWLFDVFGAYPTPGTDDEESMGRLREFLGSREQTCRILQRIGFPTSELHLVAGLIEDTLPTVETFPVALLHIDCNFHDAVRTCLEVLYDRVVSGGYVVLNDYGRYAGCKKAVDEFALSRCIALDLVQIDSDAYYFRKR